MAAPLDIAGIVKAIAEAMKAEPTTITVLNQAVQGMRTVIDYDEYGDFAGYHEEPIVAPFLRNGHGDIVGEPA